jgi:hypothetical protein
MKEQLFLLQKHIKEMLVCTGALIIPSTIYEINI